jgi:hypothetical protein
VGVVSYPRKIQEGFVFVLREYNVAGESKHFEQLHGLVIDFGKNNSCAVLFGNVDDAQKY